MSNVLAFPDTPTARLRRQLRYCRNDRMLDQWATDFRRYRHELDEVVAAELAAQAAVRKYHVSMGAAR
jgi:Spy/CpxP family protein refolding chaperone